jgi:hypothetical protein
MWIKQNKQYNYILHDNGKKYAINMQWIYIWMMWYAS